MHKNSAACHPSPDALNPMGTDGFEFVEYAALEPAPLEELFARLGFSKIARHRSKNVHLWRQGDINFILNAEKESQAAGFYNAHGPSANAMAFRVKDAAAALKRAGELGIEIVGSQVGPMELNIPAIRGVGGSLIYLVDRYGDQSIYDIDFKFIAGADKHPKGAGLTGIDHLTHNVYRGHMDEWAGFYRRVFHFREIRYFDIEGKRTGLKSRAMTSPCGKIRIPINESADDKSQIEEYLRDYKGEGIQHIALAAGNIYETVEALKGRGVRFMDPPPATYYDKLDARLPGHGEDVARLKRNGILMDGAPTNEASGAGQQAPDGKDASKPPPLLLQIFTSTVIGPIFFEVIRRKGDEGFGEGNFRALFASIEEDQVKRGVLKE
ncbi:MAG: 4-hydroxyphenylpyruvate dioxygenase [Pseudomonadota bacterium]|nr:4-hydroxyphenylpyruvate dioxygenase [Pseudomonadota bacterium]MDE3037638.1 4-hydroxyphenylpyruvate dioxygenase [Pseudomonadota bacterium]